MPRQITLFPVSNGFVVKAGCQVLAYTDKELLKRDLADYVNDPDKKEKEVIERLNLNPAQDVRAIRSNQDVCNQASPPPPLPPTCGCDPDTSLGSVLANIR